MATFVRLYSTVPKYRIDLVYRQAISALFDLLDVRCRRRFLRSIFCNATNGLFRSAEYKHTGTPHGRFLEAQALIMLWLQWYDLSQKDTRPIPDLSSHPSQRNHRFFDSKGPGGVCTPRPASLDDHQAPGGQSLEIHKDHIVQYAHYGYVYCMLLATDLYGDHETLISGGGDGVIKLWCLGKQDGGAITHPMSLENGDDSILALALDGTILYSGRLEGEINVWDLDTRQLIRRVKAHSVDVLTLSVGHGSIFSGASNGIVKVRDLTFHQY